MRERGFRGSYVRRSGDRPLSESLDISCRVLSGAGMRLLYIHIYIYGGFPKLGVPF